jgi:hypothetical protein
VLRSFVVGKSPDVVVRVGRLLRCDCRRKRMCDIVR